MDMEALVDPALLGALRALLVPAFSPRRWRAFIDAGGRPEHLTSPESALLGERLRLDRRESQKLVRALADADPTGELAAARSAGVSVLAWGSEGYPAAFAHLADPPPAVHLRGSLLACDERAIAVVGSRDATPYGLSAARLLAGDLARAGVTVLSGLARGIDAAAHQAALDAGGRSIAVLGSGLLEPYPPEHVDLLERIVRSGAALSEFSLRAEPARLNFPRRNRLIAALAMGVLVVEAGERSGALGTVRHALDLGRLVLAVPGRIDEEGARGTLRLLKEGAAPVGSAEDVFAALGWCASRTRELPEAERQILDMLPEEGCDAAQAAALVGCPSDRAAGLLITLEVRGLVRRDPTGRYLPL